jgi:hypothetical protein
MALNKLVLENNLKTRIKAINPMNSDAATIVSNIIAEEVDAYIRGIQVQIVVPSGIAVTVGSETGSTTQQLTLTATIS